MRKFGEVAVCFDPDDVSSGTVEGSGVSTETPAQSTSDANKGLTRTPEQLESDRRAQQSVYDRKIAELQRQLQETHQQLEQFKVQGLDEPGKVAYELQQARAKLEEYAAKERITTYADAFVEMGIPRSKLDLTDEQSVVNSGWAAAIEEMKRLREEAQANKGQAPAKTAAPQNTTKVITGSGGVPRHAATQAELMTSLAQSMGKQSITREEFYKWAERNPDAFNQWLIDQATE